MKNEIREEIHNYANIGHVPHDASPEALLEMSRRWARIENRRIEREAVRALMSRALPVDTGTVGKMHSLAQSIVSTAVQDWSDILDLCFRLPDGRPTTWGDASVEEHRACAQAMEYNAAGLITTAARHLMAVQELQRAGVDSLKDLP